MSVELANRRKLASAETPSSERGTVYVAPAAGTDSLSVRAFVQAERVAASLRTYMLESLVPVS